MRSQKSKTALLISLIISITIVFHYTGLLQGAEHMLRGLVSPASQAVYNWSVEINNEKQEFTSVDELEQAYRDLKHLYAENVVDKTTLERVQEENVSLKEQLTFVTKERYSHISTEVIGKNIDPLGSTLILAAGSTAGIAVGNPVIIGNGVLIGKIYRVEEDMSVVRLIDDTQSKIAATVFSQSRSIGVVEGGYGLSTRMNFIPQNENINAGDVIITSGLEAGVPRGLVIGTIQAIQKEPYEPFQSALLAPVLDLHYITVATVLIQPSSEQQ